MNVSLLLLLFSISAQLHAINIPYKAFIAAPVVDMVGDPLRDEQYYKDIPISWGPSKEDQICCPRVHQGLFNEIVKVVRIEGDWALVALENCYWQKADSDERLNQVWMQKKYLIPFDDLKKRNISTWYIPEPVNSKRHTQSSCNVITLLLPYFDQLTKKTYSAGTRFVCTDSKKYGYYAVYIFDRHDWQFKKTFIPDNVCHCPTTKKSEKIGDFVALLRIWARHEGFIPHCWGGSSLTQFYQHVGFSLHNKKIGCAIAHYWKLDSVPKEKVWTGFDMSGLVLRAAQICGIPYFYKNTTTAVKNLRPLEHYEAVHEGDLIWVPGGLFVISDLTRHTLIGSLGYQHGYGKVVELAMSDLFDGIETMTDLINDYFYQHSLRMKNSDGKIYRTVDQFKILKMKSVWQS